MSVRVLWQDVERTVADFAWGASDPKPTSHQGLVPHVTLGREVNHTTRDVSLWLYRGNGTWLLISTLSVDSREIVSIKGRLDALETPRV